MKKFLIVILIEFIEEKIQQKNFLIKIESTINKFFNKKKTHKSYFYTYKRKE